MNWAVGVGKSHCIDDIIDYVISGSSGFDLVIALFPRHSIIDERRIVLAPPPGSKIVRLRPRPSDSCANLDSDWRFYEKHGLGMLGRENLCGKCSKMGTCFWPSQYSRDNLEGAKIVLGTQAHLVINTDFVDSISRKVGAKRVLLLVDEDHVVKTRFKRMIAIDDLRRLSEVVKNLSCDDYFRTLWGDFLSRVMSLDTDALDDPLSIPRLPADLRLEIERTGFKRFGRRFRNVIFDLVSFARSPVESREKFIDGSLQFAAVPEIDSGVIIFSATANLDLLNYRLGVPFENPFGSTKFRHPGTRWYNLASGMGFATSFFKNSPQILDFFSELIGRRVAEGKRILLISKKDFKSFCIAGLESRFEQQGVDVKLIGDRLTATSISPANVIPVIHFGVVGVNLFTNFDCVFCLTGYYIRQDVISEYLQEGLSTNLQIDVEIRNLSELPRRRTAFAHGDKNKYSNVNRLAHSALMEHEMGVVVQAVGRCRPFTKPREVITFQCSDNSWHEYTAEFDNLEEMREYFGVMCRRKSQAEKNRLKVQTARAKGLTAAEIIRDTNLSKSSVYRYLKMQKDGK